MDKCEERRALRTSTVQCSVHKPELSPDEILEMTSELSMLLRCIGYLFKTKPLTFLKREDKIRLAEVENA